MTEFRTPAPMIWDGNVSHAWKKFVFEMNVYLEAANLSRAADKRKVFILLNLIGQQGQEIYQSFEFEDYGDKLDFQKVIEKFNDYCNPIKNVVFERFQFLSRTQKEGESFKSWLLELRTLIQSCEFKEMSDEMLVLMIVMGIRDETIRERLLRSKNLTVTSAIEYIVSVETSKARCLTMKSNEGKLVEVDNLQNGGGTFKCRNCGISHKIRECPAFNVTCYNCGGKHHYKKFCKKKSHSRSAQQKQNQRKIEGIEEESSEECELVVSMVEKAEVNACEREWNRNILVNDEVCCFKLDTGSEVNIIPVSMLKNMKNCCSMTSSKVTLVSYGNFRFKSMGSICLSCRKTTMSEPVLLKFEVVEFDSKPLLGLGGCKSLNLIKLIDHIDVQSFLKKYDDVFSGAFQGYEK